LLSPLTERSRASSTASFSFSSSSSSSRRNVLAQVHHPLPASPLLCMRHRDHTTTFVGPFDSALSPLFHAIVLSNIAAAIIVAA
jgi:hypothetical protein